MNRKSLLAASALTLVSAGFANAAAIAVWNFNSSATVPELLAVSRHSLASAPTLTNSGASTNFGGSTVNADSGDVAGQALAIQGSSTGGGTTAPQNGLTLTFALNTTGFENLVLTYATRTSGTSGFTSQQWAYSTNGGSSFTNSLGITGYTTNFGLQTVDLSGLAALDDNANVQVRVTLAGATAGSGNNRFDNVVFSADEIVTNVLPTFSDGGDYAVTVDVSPAGLEIVPTLNASASDTDSANTVAVTATDVPDFLTFATTDGNPADFSFTSNRGLTYADVGTYVISLSAGDGTGSTATTYTVNVVPEPTTLTALGGVSVLLLRRRK